MVKCINCAWFPWVPGADFSNLPAQRCHPDLKMRRWTNDSVNTGHNCPHFKQKEDMSGYKEDEDTPDTAKMTVKQLKKYLQTVEDRETLEKFRVQEENADSPRVTAIEAIETRLEELEEGEG